MDKVRKQLGELNLVQDQIVCFVKNEIDFWSNVAINYLMVTSENEESKEETKLVLESILKEDVEIIKSMIDKGVAEKVFESCDSQRIAVQILSVSQG